MPSLLLITPESAEIKGFRAFQYNNFMQLTMPYLAGFVSEEYEIELVDEVVGDIRSFSNKHFVFWDDNFFADPLYAKKLLKALQKGWLDQG